MALTKSLGGSGGGGITQLTGDVTAGPGSGSQAATIANGAVDIAHLSATGTPSSSTYLRGDNTWATPTGTTQYPIWSPHKPPASANALDVEFASSSSISSWPAGWTAGSAGDFPNAVFPATEPGRFSMYDTTGTWKGRYAACPAGDFNLAAYVQVNSDAANYSLIGVGFIPSTTTGAFGVGANAAVVFAGYHSGNGGWSITVDNTSGAIQQWGSCHATQHGVVLYVRRVGSNWFFGWTADGHRGSESAAFTGYSPTNIQVTGMSTRGTLSTNILRWVRVVTSTGARQDWGGLL